MPGVATCPYSRLERAYDAAVERWITREAWWNGLEDQASRRIWLRSDGARWCVEARQGPSRNGAVQPWRRVWDSESAARTYAQQMRDRNDDVWREMPPQSVR